MRAALVFLGLLAAGLVHARGYPLVAMALVSCCLAGMHVSPSQRWRGAVLAWRRGQWCLDHRGRVRAVELLPGCVALPGLVYLDVREIAAGQRLAIWLFDDCTDPRALRRLRVRLCLQRGSQV